MSGAKASSGIIEYSGANTPEWISNLGITLSGGVLTVTDAQGAALSPSNPGWVTVPSTTHGQMISLKVTAPASFNDDSNASSDLTNLGFGITESADWGQDVPFFLYVANRGNSNIDGADGSSVFFLARSPCLRTTPSSANDIGDTGLIPVNDSQNVILILDDVTVANYTSLSCQKIGAIRMQWSTTTDDWTVQTLDGSDGLGSRQLKKTHSKRWVFPIGQNGGTSHLIDNGGQAPYFATSEYIYQIDEYGVVTIEAYLEGDHATDGSGAVQARLALPYTVPSGTVTALSQFVGQTTGATTITGLQALFAAVTENTSYADLYYLDASAVVTSITNAMYSNGSRNIRFKMSYNAFNN